MLKSTAHAIAVVRSMLFMQTGIIPHEWETANVIQFTKEVSEQPLK